MLIALVRSSIAKSSIEYYDLTTGIRIEKFDSGSAHHIKVPKVGNYFYTEHTEATNIIKKWDITTKEVVMTLTDRHFPMAALPNGEYIVCVFSKEKKAYIIDTKNNAIIHTLEGNIITHAIIGWIDITKDGKYIIHGGRDEEIRVWDSESGEIITRINVKKWFYAVGAMPDGKQMVGITRNTVYIWDIINGHLVQSIITPTDIATLAISSDGNIIISGGEKTYVWRKEGGIYKNYLCPFEDSVEKKGKCYYECAAHYRQLGNSKEFKINEQLSTPCYRLFSLKVSRREKKI